MEGEIVRFRKRLFGGFNRKDVVAYIAKTSAERDASVEAARKAEGEAQKLREEESRLKDEQMRMSDELTRLRDESSRLKAKLAAYENLIRKLKNRTHIPGSGSKPASMPEEPRTQGQAPETAQEASPEADPKKSVIIIKRKKKKWS